MFSKIISIANCPGPRHMLRATRRRPLVLFYHGVIDGVTDCRIQGLHVPLALFERQIDYLRKNFEIVSMQHLEQSVDEGRNLHPRQVVITFDDGYNNNARLAAPLLNSRDIPFTIFLSTRNIDTGDRFPTYYLRTAVFYAKSAHARLPSIEAELDLSTEKARTQSWKQVTTALKHAPQTLAGRIVDDLRSLLAQQQWDQLNERFESERPMTWDTVRSLHDHGVTFGSHCHDHAILHAGQPPQQVARQLATSRDTISRHLGQCRYFAFPNGDRTNIAPWAPRQVAAKGYSLGFSVVAGEIHEAFNRYALPRRIVPMDFNHFRFVLNNSSLYNRRCRQWQDRLAPCRPPG